MNVTKLAATICERHGFNPDCIPALASELASICAENAKLRDAAQTVYDRLHELGCFTDEQETLRVALER